MLHQLHCITEIIWAYACRLRAADNLCWLRTIQSLFCFRYLRLFCPPRDKLRFGSKRVHKIFSVSHLHLFASLSSHCCTKLSGSLEETYFRLPRLSEAVLRRSSYFFLTMRVCKLTVRVNLPTKIWTTCRNMWWVTVLYGHSEKLSSNVMFRSAAYK